MSILCVLEKRERVIRELVEGKECATKLKYLLLQKPLVGGDEEEAGYVSVEALLAKVQRSFSEILSVLTSSSSEVVANGEVAAAASSNIIDLRSEEASTESRKRSSVKDRRGSYKRRKTEHTSINVSENIEDNHAWRKYGQKEILNSKFPRNYYRCTRKYDQGCRATKQVQMIQENPVMYQITYIGFHTCKGTLLKAPQMVTCSDHTTCDSMVPHQEQKQEQDHGHAPIISTQAETQTTTVKQEYYPNKEESTQSDLTDNLDLWSDFNDYFELSKPSIGVFSNSHFCSTDFHFDHESHHLL